MKKILTLAALCGFASLSAFAATGCTGDDAVAGAINLGTSTGNTLVGNDSTDICTLANGDTFSNFAIDWNGIGTNTPYTLDVSVSGNTLDFTTDSLANGADLKIYFETTSEPPSVTLAAGGGDTVTETVCSVSFAPGSEACGGTSLLVGPSVDAGGLTCSGCGGISANITPSTTEFFVKDDSGGSFVSQTFVPEPMTLSLVGASLLGLGFVRRARNKR